MAPKRKLRPALLSVIERTLTRCNQIETAALESAPAVAATEPVAAYLGGKLTHATLSAMRKLAESDELHVPERFALLIVQITAATHIALDVLHHECEEDQSRDWLELWLCELQRSLVYASSLGRLGDSLFADEPEGDELPDPFRRRMAAPSQRAPRSNKDMN